MKSKSLASFLHIAVLTGLFCVPFISLIITNSLYFPFISGKAFTFRILIEILFTLWVVLMLLVPEYRPKKSWLMWLVSGLLLSLIVSTIFGVNPYRSFWSNFERMEGLIGYLHLFAFFLVIGSVFRSERWWSNFFKVILGVSFILILYGLLQISGVIKIIQGVGRIEATFGNATYFAAFLLITAFLSLYLLWRERGKRFARWVYGGLFALQVFMLSSTQTRGAMLGLIGGLSVSILLIAWRERQNLRLRRIAFISIAVIAILVALFFVFRSSVFVQENGVLGRLATISLSAGRSRFLIWNMAWQGFKENPVLGWGPENFIFLFNKYYNPQLFSEENWFDRAHNVFLDWLVHTGLIGLLLYLSVFAVALYFIWRYRQPGEVVGPSILTGLFLAYLIQNLFVFDNLMSYVLFLTILAYLHFRASSSQSSVSRPLTTRWIWPIGGALVVVTVLAVYYINLKPIGASRLLIRSFTDPSAEESFHLMEKALAAKTFLNPELKTQLGIATINRLGNQELDFALRQKFFDVSTREINEEVKKQPGHALYPLYMGILLRRGGQDQAALPYLQLAHQFSPKKQLVTFELVSLYLDIGEKDLALELAKSAFDSAPEFEDARGVYADALVRNGKVAEAKELISGVKIPDLRLINAFVEAREYDIVLMLWQKMVERWPDDPQFRFSLAAAYLQVGQRSNAIVQLEKAKEVNPAATDQADSLIKEIKAGRNPLRVSS